MANESSVVETDNKVIAASNFIIDEALQLSLQSYIDKIQYRNLIGKLLLDLRGNLSKYGYEDQQISDVQYGLVAFIDEQILKSKIDNKFDWQAEQLQLIHFNDTLAGERFFQKLRSYMEDQNDKSLDIVELYYLILLLGFTGVYIMIPDERRKFIEEVQSHLEFSGRLKPGLLSPHGVDGDHYQLVDQPVIIPKRWVNVISIMTAVLMSLYLIFTLILHSQVVDLKSVLLR